MMIENHKSYRYALNVTSGEINAPKYVKIQCQLFLDIANDKNDKYIIDESKVKMIDNLLKLMNMAKGLNAGDTVYNSIAGFQAFFIIAILCTVHRDDKNKRKYEISVLEICRKNGKTWLVNVIFMLLFLLEPKFSKFYSVAPDGALSREVKEAINETISVSPTLESKFKIRRDDIECLINKNKYIPLNYSNSRLDGKLPSVFLVDETGALPNPYAIEAMKSGQLTIRNKLGCIISTKYPKIDNPFEDEVEYAKKVLDGLVQDEKLFALLYEPDDVKNWATNDDVLEQANPLAIEVPEIMDDLKDKRKMAIEVPSKRENFITKHCNIIYQGIGTESYIDVNEVKKCKIDNYDWTGRDVWVGLDLALSSDNCSFSMTTYDEGNIVADSFAFIPEDRIEEKSNTERVHYREFIRDGKCFACGDAVVDYGFIEDMILQIEDKYGVKVKGVGYDRWNALSTAQRLEREGNLKVVEIKQFESILHMPTKLLKEKILKKEFTYLSNKLLEINFQNAKLKPMGEHQNMMISKKRSNGKIDMVASLINAIYLMQQDIDFNKQDDFVVQVI